MHPTKQIKNEKGLYPVCDLYSCKGASEIYDKADVGITAWRNELEDYCEAHITKVKFRHLGEKGHCCFKFNLNNGRFVSIPDVDNLKKSGVPLSSLMIDWDNSNYILDKLKREAQPQPFFPKNESWHNQEPRDINQNKDNGLPFASGDESCPF